MEMWMIGFLLGVLLVILIAVIVFTVRKSQSKETYDERQRTARGEAGKIGFVAAMVGFLILFMIELFAAEKGLNINLLFPIAVIAFVSLGISIQRSFSIRKEIRKCRRFENAAIRNIELSLFVSFLETRLFHNHQKSTHL